MSEIDDAKRAESIWAGEDNVYTAAGNENVKLIQRLYDEVWNQGNFSVLGEMVSPSYVNYDWPPGTPGGLQGYEQVVSTFRKAFPDLVMNLDQVTAEDNRIAMRVTARGTHKGDFFGFNATNKEVSFGGMVFTHVEDGLVSEGWEIVDRLALVQQIGKANG